MDNKNTNEKKDIIGDWIKCCGFDAPDLPELKEEDMVKAARMLARVWGTDTSSFRRDTSKSFN